MTKRHWRSVLSAGLMMVLAASAASAQRAASNVDRAGLGLKGYDPVAYLTDGRPIKGQETFTATHDGVTYRFASSEHKRQFLAEPAKYVPQYGGYCAMGVALGKKLPIDPEAFRIVDGKLYLNVNKDVQRDWVKDIPGNIARADAQWPALHAGAAG